MEKGKKELKSDKVPQDQKALNDLLDKLKNCIGNISKNLKEFLDLYRSNKEYKYFLMKKINDNYFIENTVTYNELTTFENILRKSQKIFAKVKQIEELQQVRGETDVFKKNQIELQKFRDSVEIMKTQTNEARILGNKRKKTHNAEIDSDDEKNNPLIEGSEEIPFKDEPFQTNDPKNENSSINQNYMQTSFLKCYVCKAKLGKNLHYFYSQMCEKCGEFNMSHRKISMNLKGRIAIVTGGRIKIGYHTAIKLLNFGCKVIVTTRFPQDALQTFKKEDNFDEIKDNLVIYPLDLRHFSSIQKFLCYIHSNFPHLDILINNAAQTIKRENDYYKCLIQAESSPLLEEDKSIIVTQSDVSLALVNENMISFTEGSDDRAKLFPKGMVDAEGQQLDLSEKTSWSLEADQIPFLEFAEAQVINSWAPYYLCCKLKTLLEKSPFPDRFIINVTSQEGIFAPTKKTTHPHTNMAKASLNMFTATSGDYFKKNNIYMCCVDPGWVSYMSEYTKLLNSQSFQNVFVNVPLDAVDGAMRILHPIYEGIKNKNYYVGCLLKNYMIHNY